MTSSHRACIAVMVVVLAASVVAQRRAPPDEPVPAGLPEWAYEYPAPGEPTAPSALPSDDKAIVRLPSTERTLTRAQLRGVDEIPEWHPEDRRGEMPPIVRNGKKETRACGWCHYASGSGRPENASVNGLHPAYFIQQMEDFKNGLRDSADPRKGNTNNMILFARNSTPEETRAAAEYFAAQPYPKRIKVVESRTAPKLILQDGMHLPVTGADARMEPLGDHIVEVPDDPLQAAARDSRMGWTAYVPVGSVGKGKAAATRFQCAMCHGSDLRGLGAVPPLAGRSPSYTMRQLFDIKVGTRRGPWSELMKPVVAKMTVDDMVNVSAYTASLTP